MQKISVVLATFNEEENLGRCLESIRDLAWEVIVVDGGSTDKTIEIAKQFSAKIIQTDNPPIFHINKNKAIDAADGNWILQIDADETVSKELAEEIKRAVSSKTNINGYWMPRKNLFLGMFLTKGGQYPDYTLRLYRKGKGRLPAKDVHEQAVVEGKIGYFKNDLLHLRDKNFSAYMERFNRYTDLLSVQIKQEGIKVGAVSFIDFIFIKPILWFLKVYFRHRGYVDKFPGFVFALFSAFRFPIAYIKSGIHHENRD